MVAADLKARIERTDHDTPRRLPVPERNSRLDALKKRLVGLELTGKLAVAHSLVDMASQMAEDNAVKYIPWKVHRASTRT